MESSFCEKPDWRRRFRRPIDTDGSVIFTSFCAIRVIGLIPENASRTEWRTGPWRRSTRRLVATSIRRS